jgi:hypothetical protein
MIAMSIGDCFRSIVCIVFADDVRGLVRERDVPVPGN